ncbi:MAG: NAD-dependent epimerase/dehydratase family protein [Luteitalea sp.]|nr:NAD-dependent epimerase/dehydratase family protein [Luteitalea sp.]
MRALVTGAAGFIGSHLCERLLAQEAEVVGLDAFTDYYTRALKEANLHACHAHPKFQLQEARLQDAELAPLLRDVTHVFHMAAQPGVRKSWGRDFDVYVRDNIDATQRLLEACTVVRLERFVYASTSSVYGDEASIPMREEARLQPLSPYGVSKLAAEHLCHLYCQSYGVPAVSLRYFTVYGPRQRPDMAFHRFLKAAIEGRAVTLYGDGEQTRDFTFVGDAVSAALAAASRGGAGRVYNVGGGSRVSVNQVLALIEQLMGRPLKIERLPAQRGDMRDTYADTSRARQELGFSPETTLEEGLHAEYQWLSTISQSLVQSLRGSDHPEAIKG